MFYSPIKFLVYVRGVSIINYVDVLCIRWSFRSEMWLDEIDTLSRFSITQNHIRIFFCFVNGPMIFFLLYFKVSKFLRVIDGFTKILLSFLSEILNFVCHEKSISSQSSNLLKIFRHLNLNFHCHSLTKSPSILHLDVNVDFKWIKRGQTNKNK